MRFMTRQSLGPVGGCTHCDGATCDVIHSIPAEFIEKSILAIRTARDYRV